jgi:hypothetical protein
MTGYAYTPLEDDLIRQWYPKEGLPGALVKLNLAGYSRTSNSVRRRASVLQIKSPYCTANTLPAMPSAPYSWKPKWDAPYAKAQDLISQGVTVANACRMVGMERSMFYRMRKMKEGK